MCRHLSGTHRAGRIAGQIASAGPIVLAGALAGLLAGCASGGTALPGLTGTVAPTNATSPAATQPESPATVAAVSSGEALPLPTPASTPPSTGGGIVSAAFTTALPSVLTKSDRLVSTPPTETYALIARGATRCWFGRGPLRSSHVFHADAEPASKGGRVSVAIHERDAAADSPRGFKAYRIEVVGSPSGGSVIEQENMRFPGTVAETMRRDVGRWANGDLACRHNEELQAFAHAAPGSTPAPAPASAPPPPAPAKLVPVKLKGTRR